MPSEKKASRATRAPIFLIGLCAAPGRDDTLRPSFVDIPELYLADAAVGNLHATLFRTETYRGRMSERLRALHQMAGQRIDMAEDGRVLDDPGPIVGLLSEVGATLTPQRHLAAAHRRLETSPHTQVYGEITASHDGVTAWHFRKLRDSIDAAGFRPRLVMLLQDPVIWCLNRVSQSAAPLAGVADVINRADVREALDYRRIIADLEASFSAGDHLIVLQGEPPALQRASVAAFLGVDFHEAPATPIERAAPKPGQDDVQCVRATFADTYAVCNERFGEEHVARIWV